ncbi:VanZ family protein [Margalitia sp. FSL K6-0131]|uniref:VanZ family protein n=1 Tax=Margalitia sp. FSL K6-0131 TaxID=2954604 RepID=UPI0030FCA2C1
MRLQEIIGIVREYFFLALIAVIVLGIVFILGYYIVYKNLFKGKGSLYKKQLLLGGLFIGYIIMVIGVTFLNRGPAYHDRMDLSFLSSYREAWYSFSVRLWQYEYLNIFMFVPFGILFPLLHKRFQKAAWTIGIAALFTLSIESLQLITRYGIFAVDDLFNNLLGGIIGYGIIMGIITIKEKGIKRSFFYFSPLLIVVMLFGSMYSYYHLKEFGNLSIVPSYRLDTSQAKITLDGQLDDQRKTVPIYKAPSYTKVTAEKFVRDFFDRMSIDTSDMEVILYPDEGFYRINGEKSYNISFRFLDGSYNFTDFSSFDNDKKLKDADQETLKENLTKYGIDIPQDSQFQKTKVGTYKWTVDKKVRGNQLIDGSLGVTYYNDDTVKGMDNQLITYDKVRDVQIKSEQEAYKEVLNGKFQLYPENTKIKTLKIHKVEVSYYLDSKGFYQPVYAFQSTVNGMDRTILIPGI